jgi:hypothetical protein
MDKIEFVPITNYFSMSTNTVYHSNKTHVQTTINHSNKIHKIIRE